MIIAVAQALILVASLRETVTVMMNALGNYFVEMVIVIILFPLMLTAAMTQHPVRFLSK